MNKLANVYTEENICKWYSEREPLPDERLFSYRGNRCYPTKLTAADLPEEYLEVWLYRTKSYINIKKIKDVKYHPVGMLENHLFKDDSLLISFDKPIEKMIDERGFEYYSEDIIVWNWDILRVLKALEKYAGWDISLHKEEIWEKCLTLKNEPEFGYYIDHSGNKFKEVKVEKVEDGYKWEAVPCSDEEFVSYFDTHVKSREEFERWFESFGEK